MQQAQHAASKHTNDLHAPLRPLAIKAVVAAALMVKRNALKKA